MACGIEKHCMVSWTHSHFGKLHLDMVPLAQVVKISANGMTELGASYTPWATFALTRA